MASRFPISEFLARIQKENRCFRVGAVLAGNQIKVIRQMNYGQTWMADSRTKEAVADMERQRPKERTSKRNLYRALELIDNLIFSESKGARRNAARRVIVVPTTRKIKDIKLRNAVANLLEDRVAIIAVALAEGKKEEVRYITNDENRIIFGNSLRDLNSNSVTRDVIDLLRNPDKKRVSPINKVAFSLRNIQPDFVAEEDLCEYTADIAFLVDSSNSIKLDYDKQLFFVQRIARRFGLSETGTHAAVVIFSDIGYVKLTIKLKDFYDVEKFNQAVANSPFYGWRTRIDLGLQVVKDELFTVAEGARPNMKRLLFLITDGKQNPKKDKKTGEIYDPLPLSKTLIKDGVDIFAVGIGTNYDRAEMIAITQDESRVYNAADIEDLVSDKFVKDFAKKTCSEPGKLNPTMSSNGTGCCCCGSKVYINIFQAGTGPNYVMQGAEVTQYGNTADTVTAMMHPESMSKIPAGRGMSKMDLMNVIKNSLGKTDKKLADSITKMLEQSTSLRKRRSLDSFPDRLPRFSEILKVAKLSGCNKFILALENYGITDEISGHVSKNKTVTLFCPVDKALENITLYPSDKFKKAQIRELLRHHVAIKQDSFGTMYHSMLNRGHIVLHPKHMGNQVSWTVEDSNIKFSLYDGQHGEIVVIDKVITPPLTSLMQTLKSHPQLTHMYKLMNKVGGLDGLLRSDNVEKLCFKHDLCVRMSQEMRERMKEALKFKQITLLVPSDQIFEAMGKWDTLKLYSNAEKRRDFMRRHIYLGCINKDTLTSEVNLLAQPIESQNAVAVLHSHNGVAMVTDAEDKTYKLTESIRVKEGIILVEDIV